MNKKTLILSLILLMAGICFAGDISIWKDKTHDYSWWLYTPVDEANGVWARTRIGIDELTNGSDVYSVNDTFVGKVYDGRVYDRNDATADSGTWTPSVLNSTWLTYSPTNAATLEFTIPAGHNRIHILVQSDKLFEALWKDTGTGVGLDVSGSFEQVGNNTLQEIVIATNSTHNASVDKTLVIHAKEASARFSSLQTWDTSTVGDPRTISSDLVVGHDLLDIIDGTVSSSIAPINIKVSGGASKLTKESTWAIAVQSTPDGNDPRWTSTGGHFGAGDAIFRPDAATTLTVDSVAKSNYNDNATNPVGRMYVGAEIVSYNAGFGDYDQDSIKDATDVEITSTETYNDTGLDVANTLAANGSTIPIIYQGMIEVPTDANPNVIFADTSESHPLAGTSDRVITGNASALYDFIDSGILVTSADDLVGWLLRDSTSFPPKGYVDVTITETSFSSLTSFKSAAYMAENRLFTYLDILLQGDFVTDTAWPTVTDWDTSGGNATFTSTGTDRTLAQPTIALVDGFTYKVTFTASNIDLQDPTAYYGIQLGGGTANRFTQDGTYVYYIQAGGSTGSGLEISSVNTTTGDTLTVDNISVIVEHFKPSTNLDSIFVTGDIKVPAGADVVVNGDFQTDTDWNKGTNWAIDTGDNVAEVLIVPGAASLLTASVDPLTPGIEYLFSFNAEVSAGQLDFYMGLGFVDSATGFETVTGTAVCPQGSSRLDFEASADFLGNVSNIVIIPLTDGPIDEYPWDEFGDYGEDPGMLNGERVYKSTNTHANGFGGADANYHIWSRPAAPFQLLSVEAGIFTAPAWFSVTGDLIGDYNVASGAIGTATTTYGPVNHSEASGSAGLETDGNDMVFVDCKTRHGYINGLRDGKFGIVSVFEVSSDTGTGDRVVSAETSTGTGLYYTKTLTATGTVWSGTNSLNSIIVAPDDTLNNTLVTADLSISKGYGNVNGILTGSDTNTSGLVAVDATKLRLGGRANDVFGNSIAKYGFTAVLDLTNVATVDAAWSTGLSIAINAVTSYDPHAIAAAIYNYDNNITGHYYALNELSSGDGSNYYLLAYDIQTQTAITQGVYGLTSPSGVTGTVLVPAPSTGGGYRGRYQGLYRARYNGVGRY